MKQYTNESQTAKLIELGFEKPKMAAPALKWVDGEPTFEPQYTIGELIEMLPMEDRAGERSMVYDGLEWVVNWDNDDGKINQVVANELIDTLYDMVVKLKEEGVI
ncbi:MAG: hypothetical protein J6U48_05070 [Alistipes sp.]|nr:hypothetical protein [Alistipes sp.]